MACEDQVLAAAEITSARRPRQRDLAWLCLDRRNQIAPITGILSHKIGRLSARTTSHRCISKPGTPAESYRTVDYRSKTDRCRHASDWQAHQPKITANRWQSNHG